MDLWSYKYNMYVVLDEKYLHSLKMVLGALFYKVVNFSILLFLLNIEYSKRVEAPVLLHHFFSN
jgi:hypothetical protein